MNNWVKCILDDILQYEQPQPYIVKNDEYSDDFKIPVLTAGKSFIIGKTNENFGIYDKLPVIIFDDFTTASQFVNFKFKVKSSAMKILSVRHHSLDIKFFYYLMKTINCPHDTHKRYWISDYSQKEISLPPLAEQERIVAKIEELFAGIDAGVENLKSVKNQIALYRQSVLKSAFNIKNAVIQKASEIGEVSLGRQRSPKNISKFYPTKYIRAANISENGIDVSDILDMEFLPYEKEKYLLKQNDILLSEASGSPNQVGKPAIWNNEIDDCCFQNTVIRHRLFSNHPKYVFWFYKYLYLSSFFAKLAGGVGINHIGSTKFSNIEIPIPSLDEQKRIVAEIESRFKRADALETAVDRALNEAEKLKQAVLKKAFSGKLVPQNPDDEPASVLLDRIRAARASELPAKKGKRKKTEVDSQLQCFKI